MDVLNMSDLCHKSVRAGSLAIENRVEVPSDVEACLAGSQPKPLESEGVSFAAAENIAAPKIMAIISRRFLQKYSGTATR
jgi:hypothetical protein